MEGWKIYGGFQDGSLKGRLFGKVENGMEEKMGGKKIKEGPQYFILLKLEGKVEGKFFIKAMKMKLLFCPLINYKKIK